MVTKTFVLAGQATFTIECPDGRHFTFRVDNVPANGKWDESWFVKMLTGPDNTSDYTYIGRLNDFTGQVSLTQKSRVNRDTFSFLLLNKVLARIWSNDHAAYTQHGYKVHHEGKCGCCGRKLTTPESVESGIGPICAGRMN